MGLLEKKRRGKSKLRMGWDEMEMQMEMQMRTMRCHAVLLVIYEYGVLGSSIEYCLYRLRVLFSMISSVFSDIGPA